VNLNRDDAAVVKALRAGDDQVFSDLVEQWAE
jgi:hypothetical protein